MVQRRWSKTARLTCYGNYGVALGLLPTSGGQMQAPLSKCGVSSVRSKDVVGALDQQASEVRVAGLGDPELRIAFAGLTAFWSQAQIAAHVPTSTKAFLVTQRQYERESRDVTDAVNG